MFLILCLGTLVLLGCWLLAAGCLLTAGSQVQAGSWAAVFLIRSLGTLVVSLGALQSRNSND